MSKELKNKMGKARKIANKRQKRAKTLKADKSKNKSEKRKQPSLKELAEQIVVPQVLKGITNKQGIEGGFEFLGSQFLTLKTVAKIYGIPIKTVEKNKELIAAYKRGKETAAPFLMISALQLAKRSPILMIFLLKSILGIDENSNKQLNEALDLFAEGEEDRVPEKINISGMTPAEFEEYEEDA